MTATDATGGFFPLLGDLSEVPPDYIRDVVHTKRVVERWTMDPAFREAFAHSPASAIDSLNLPLRPAQILPLLPVDEVPGHSAEHAAALADPPLSVRRYAAFNDEKLTHRDRLSASNEAKNLRMAAWRRRQMNRCVGELGYHRAQAIVHAPAAFELAKGCSVGCWFCGISASKFDQTWSYTQDNALLWRNVLATMGDIVGDAMEGGFMYWATDPLDNPEYESFLRDYHEVLRSCPQTTTALGHKDVDRTRRLFALSESLGCIINRFSIISLSALNRIHESFTPEELLRVECVPQNKGAYGSLKANAGRARRFTDKRADQLTSEDMSSTIACVSGFLFNMVEGSVRLITPCNADDLWPDGFMVIDQGVFGSAEELRDLIGSMIDRKMCTSLRPDDVVRTPPNLRIAMEDGRLHVRSFGLDTTLPEMPDAEDVSRALREGGGTVMEFALHRERNSGVPLAETMLMLDDLFVQGLLDEKPQPPSTAVPVTLQSSRPLPPPAPAPAPAPRTGTV